jgi:sugar lactone lactonase YvrE
VKQATRFLTTLAVALAFISALSVFSQAERSGRPARIKEHSDASASFGSVNVGTAAAVHTLTYTFTSSATLSAVTILTGGAPGLDYSDGGSSTCAVGTSYTTGQTCNVTVAFTPSTPGLRSGAVSLYSTGSNLPLAIWYFSGIGQSSAATIDPGTQSTLTTLANSGQASGTAVDGAGNVYVVDNANSQVFELAAGSFTSATVVSSGLLNPTAIALDGAGNLYISDTGNSRVVEVPNEQGTLNSGDLSIVSITGLGSPSGLAVDGSGNLYVADSADGNVLEIPSSGAAQLTVVSGLTSPVGLALDSAANVYVSGNNQVNEYPSGGGSPVPIGTGFNNPDGLAVDASGAIYVADSGNSRIVQVAPGGASQVTLPSTGISNPQSLAVDSSANVYVTAGGSSYEINRSLAALTFTNTEYGAVSAPQTVAVTNAGNDTLSVSNVAASANFTVVPSGGTDCTSSTNLASGLQCLVGVEFTPLATGALSGTLALTDNALNNAAATQSVQLSGTATDANASVSLASSAPGGSTYGQSVTFTATITSDTGLLKRRVSRKKPLAFSGNVTWSANTGCAESAVSGYPATATCTTSSLGGGSDTVTATYAGDANHNEASGSVSQTVNPASQTITFTKKAPASAAYGSAFSVAATASSGLAVGYSSSGSCSNSGATYTISGGSGNCVVSASQAGNTNYSAATTVTETVTVKQATQTITATTPAPTTAYKGYSFTLVATASSGLPVGYSSSGSCTNSGATFKMTSDSGTCIAELYQAGNTDYAGATPLFEHIVAESPVTPAVTFTGAPTTATPYGATSTVTASSTNDTVVPVISTTSTTCAVGTNQATGTTVSALVTITSGTGSCKLTATWAANNVYPSAKVSSTTTLTKATPTVSLSGAPGSASKGTSFLVTATSNESGPGAVIPKITATGSCTVGPATNVGPGSYAATVTITKATGTCTTKASWAVSTDYASATATETTTAN